MKALFFGSISFFLIAALFGCAPQPITESAPTNPAPTKPANTATAVPLTSTPQANILTITGWIATVWNGDAHYSITDEEGKTFKLQLDEELTKPLGGTLAIDRKKVTITGEIVNENPPTILVLSIQFAQ